MDERGVSDTLGFVFAFALVTASVGVIYTTGLGGLQDAQEDEQVTNAVRAFDVLADNVRDVTDEGAPSRATELKLSDATLRLGDPVRIEVRAVNSTNASDSASYNATIQPLIYDAPADEVVYSAGATFRVNDGAAVMRNEPGFVVGGDRQPNTTVVPLVKTYARGTSERVGGSGTVLVVAHRQSSGLDGTFSTDRTDPDVYTNVTITVESSRAEAWSRYFESNGMTPSDSDSDDGSVTYWFHTDKLIVPETFVEFDLKQ